MARRPRRGAARGLAVAALKLVHTIDHLRGLVEMSKTGGGFDTDTYCAPGSWEAMLDGTRAWMEATSLAMAGEGPAFALSRPAGHHATANVAMGFGLVNYAAAAVAARLAEAPDATVAILDWDVHHGNGVADIFKDEARVRYCSLHEVDNFPGTGLDEADRGPLGNLLNVPLPKETRSDAYLAALREKALPFLLGADGAAAKVLARAGADAPQGANASNAALRRATHQRRRCRAATAGAPSAARAALSGGRACAR